MKTFTTTIALLAGLTIGAQSAELQIRITMDQNLTGATWTNSMTLDFSQYGSHFSDGLDMTSVITNSSVAYPFTINSSYQSLLVRDARPNLYADRDFDFGVWNNTPGNLHIKAEWTNASDSLLYDVIFIENGNEHNMYSEQTFPIAADTLYSIRYTIRLAPKMRAQGFAESCYGSNDGSVYAKSPSPFWSMEVYYNSVYQSTIDVTGIDTLLTGLTQGNYSFVYMLMSQPIDTQAVTVSGQAQIISSATLSDATPAVNQSVDFTNTSTGATTYFWDFGDGFTSTTASPSHAYLTADTYTVTLTAYNAASCTGTSTYVVTAGAPSIQGPPSNLTNRNGNENEMARVITTVQSQNNNAALSVTGDATISQFSVYSANGQLLYGSTGSDKTFTYETPGIYLIQIVYSDGTAESKLWYLN
jgi:hypothetical protein